MTTKRAISREVIEDLLMIILGISILLITNGTAKVIALVILVIVAIYSCLEGVSRIIANGDRIKSLKEENKSLREEVSFAKSEQKQFAIPQTPKNSIPELEGSSLHDDTGKLKQFMISLSEDGMLSNSYRSYFNNILELIRVDEDMILFKERILEPCIMELNSTEMPLSNEDRDKVYMLLIQYSFLFLDYIDTYRFNINNTKEQLLSLQVIKGELSPDEAYKLAANATLMADETPKYIRVLKEAIKTINPNKDIVLYSGYKL